MFSLAPLLLLAALARPVDACLAKCDYDTELDIENSAIVQNDLQYGGAIRYEGVGFIDDRSIDLEVSVVPGTTYESERADLRNGKNGSGKLGVINLYTVRGDLDSGEGNFRFCLRDTETGELATAKSFVWSVFDLDNRNKADDTIKEKMAINIGQVTDYVVYPDEENALFITSCENTGLPPPCAKGDRTVFSATKKGKGADNPGDPNDLNEVQKGRTIVFSFEDTSCWDITFYHFCKIEEEEGGKCRWYGGGNFLFAGKAQQVIDEGECIVPPTDGCEDNPFPFFWKGRDTSCDEIASLGKQKQNFKCNEGRRIERECPAVCLEECETPSPTVSPTIPAPTRGDCEDNPDPFEYKGEITSCATVAALGKQKKNRKCKSGRRIPEECPTVCKETCFS